MVTADATVVKADLAAQDVETAAAVFTIALGCSVVAVCCGTADHTAVHVDITSSDIDSTTTILGIVLSKGTRVEGDVTAHAHGTTPVVSMILTEGKCIAAARLTDGDGTGRVLGEDTTAVVTGAIAVDDTRTLDGNNTVNDIKAATIASEYARGIGAIHNLGAVARSLVVVHLDVGAVDGEVAPIDVGASTHNGFVIVEFRGLGKLCTGRR